MTDNSPPKGPKPNQKSTLHNFYQKIKDDKSLPVRKILESYFKKNNIAECQTREEQGQALQNLMTLMEAKFQDIFQETDENEIELNGEGIEAIVTKNFYERIFNTPEEHDTNKQVCESINIHQKFLKPEHLEIQENRIIAERLQRACLNLQAMGSNKLPRGKLNFAINFCHEISKMLAESAKDGMPDGADTFLPMVNYSLLQLPEDAAIQLFSNMEYIRLFRHSNRLQGQDDYYLTTLSSTIEFISNLSAKDLKIDPDYYNEQYNFYKAQLSQETINEEIPKQEEADLLEINTDTANVKQVEEFLSSQVQLNSDAQPDSQLNSDHVAKIETLNGQIMDLSQQNEQLLTENISIKQLLNKFMEETYRFKNEEFEEQSVNKLRLVFNSCKELIQSLELHINQESNQSENLIQLDNASLKQSPLRFNLEKQ
ncbi:UNKNOWN [Stylonychia lemnae]|uniref:VPS9 domain-containing protein n=1 Tax=Stylonychia lemnae TaxID=5949 RepID=A0A078BFD6_STYLE|nr:UNKNOWN [Stylonychia lemnae]|eukprot:CDW91862.1 UNKNOWN [Stylonychia lemnae]